MAQSLNRIMLIGRLGQDAETRFTTTNQAATSFSVATDNNYKGKDGNWVTETTWHNIVAWNISDYTKDSLKKGKKVYVEGRLAKRDYTDKEGQKRYITEVVSERIIPLDSRDNSGAGSSPEYSQDNSSFGSQQGFNEPAAPAIDNNDDLPF